MKIIKIALGLTLTVAMVASLSSCVGAKAERPRIADLKFKEMITHIPKTKRVTLGNGIVVHLLPDHELPLIHMSAMIKVGSIWEPADKTGLAALTGQVIRAGGTKTRTPDDLDETLETIAASVETGIGGESGSASLSALSKDFKLGLEIFADVLRNPAFNEERFELAKARMLDSIRRENDSPTSVALRELGELLYAGSSYGRKATLESVGSITRDDVIAFHKKYFVPSNVMLGITGDYNEETIIAELEKVFATWSGGATAYPPVRHVKESYDGGVYIASKKLRQSVIRAGHLAVRRTDPDYFKLRVMDEILGGGGFSSRIVKKVRTDRGLAYSVWSYYIGGRWEMGRFLLGAETKTSSTAEVIEIFIDEVKRIQSEDVTKAELNLAKNSIVNSFVFIFDRSTRILGEWMKMDYYDYPENYLETYRDKVMETTIEDVRRVANEYLHPDGLKIVVVGDPDGFERSLSEFGKVSAIELRDYSEEN
ncbi:hypothetical protein MNBD_NITROSPINAE02-1463 [hydrothermal vent metagenome]|uniref:Insulinase family protein n=1 Tax=hydrothermal vent metagenome TaxID=652676 RepID=A0A3B1C2C7_9ZZZZ